MEDSQETVDEQETLDQNDVQTSKRTVAVEDFDAVKDELAFLKEQLAAQKQPQAAEAPAFTAAQLQQFQQNPALLAQWLQDQTKQSVSAIKNESAKAVWDKRAEDKFPLIKTDKDFQKKVARQIAELKSNGEYTADNPMLVYRAAQLASMEYQPKVATKEQKQFTTSVEGRGSVERQSSGSKPKISDNDPRLHFAKLLGITGPKLDKFKAGLTEYVPTQRKQARRLSK